MNKVRLTHVRTEITGEGKSYTFVTSYRYVIDAPSDKRPFMCRASNDPRLRFRTVTGFDIVERSDDETITVVLTLDDGGHDTLYNDAVAYFLSMLDSTYGFRHRRTYRGEKRA